MQISNRDLVTQIQNIRQDIPFFKKNPSQIYFDSAATALKTQTVIDAVVEYYSEYPSNVHRASYNISLLASRAYEQARQEVKNFFTIPDDYEVIFTSGTTESSNLLAITHRDILTESDTIALSLLEHHSILLPWRETATRTHSRVAYIPIILKGENIGSLNMAEANKIIPQASILAITGMSNITGYIPPLDELYDLCKKHDCKMIVDAAQLASHHKISLTETPFDALLCSAHKLGGPTGIGLLCIKKSWLSSLPKFKTGGGTISQVDLETQVYYPDARSFEAGTPNIAGALGLTRALQYIENLGWEFIEEYEYLLHRHLLDRVCNYQNIKILGRPDTIRSPIISFYHEKLHSEDLSFLLSQHNICIRSGHLCATPLLLTFGREYVARISGFWYNTLEEVDILGEQISFLNTL